MSDKIIDIVQSIKSKLIDIQCDYKIPYDKIQDIRSNLSDILLLELAERMKR